MALLAKDFHINVTGFDRLLCSLESERWAFILSMRIRPGGSSKTSIYCWGSNDREVQIVHIMPLPCLMWRAHKGLQQVCATEYCFLCQVANIWIVIMFATALQGQGKSSPQHSRCCELWACTEATSRFLAESNIWGNSAVVELCPHGTCHYRPWESPSL